MKKPLTERQKELLKIIYDFIKNTGYPPTFEEMRESLGVSSNQSVIDHLAKLEEKRVIQRKKGIARSIAILPIGYEILGKPGLAPFLGATAAGAYTEAIEIKGEWQKLSQDVAQLQENIFLLKISGDSMINAGIEDGDVVLVREAKEFVSGEIVLAETPEGTTVKRFISEDKPPYVYLKPENPNYENILFTDDVELKGKISSIMKNGTWKSVK
ncbi:MAG: repressor LexA [Candidatus Moranbacteria bacterium CG_4_10_14_3_um_filter_44_15]|nr:MAG: repressor LexA [Candidatus Moranbacteria bacterium CG06_land_8_20_14_3_00_43_56]PIV84030.1 MAG: repressor LexA [Candidatus Moranbacteria bacterium CG17_big_fil_post_rev_8_21_14_2_50_44_12]PIW92983.1 MAG: repressor LexA [Candidatus Moranbacteria bacterium CG_4_8_14_3_um_filter_43_15]PIX90958.1 MAG: repressor LexA [Candidatus Moranbacteria bacterium CG_4_10_14_3_um_filter_44_15]PJA86322.1 MAG: repressor LexA [Candidatus Moranbacteria bacterium CG_4_9_14_3_um_filter_44_28]